MDAMTALPHLGAATQAAYEADEASERPIWNQRIFYELLCCYAKGRRWLDLGCGRGPRDPGLAGVRQSVGARLYAGVDLDMESLKDSREEHKVCGDIAALPFTDRSFDVVTSNMVFEHVENPAAVLREANRLLDHAGVLLVHTASSRHYVLLAGRVLSRVLPRKQYVGLVSRYTGRRQEDIFPTRYRANTASKIREAALDAGFIGGVVGYLETPLSGRSWMRSIERPLRRLLPESFKSTILAVFLKRQRE